MSFESIITYLWNPKISLKKQSPKTWKKLDVFTTEKKEEQVTTYLSSTFLTNPDGKLEKNITFNKDGKQVELMEIQYPDDLTEITLISSRIGDSNDIQRFNEAGFLIEEVSVDPWGDTETNKYFYDENHNLEKVIQKNEDEHTWEDLIYQNGKLYKIETNNDNGGTLFRGFIYDEKGLLEKVIRMQNEFVNMEEKYFYNEHGQLIREIHESISRLKDGKNPLMITEFEYYSNGQKKSECFSVIDSYKGITKLKSTDFYNEEGLLLKQESKDFIEETESIHEYQYD